MNEDLPPSLELYAALTAAREAQDRGNFAERERKFAEAIDLFVRHHSWVNGLQAIAARTRNGLTWQGQHAKLRPGYRAGVVHEEWRTWTFLRFLDPNGRRAHVLPRFESPEAAHAYAYVTVFAAVRRLNRDGPEAGPEYPSGGNEPPLGPDEGEEGGPSLEDTADGSKVRDNLSEIYKAVPVLEAFAPTNPALRPSHEKMLTHLVLEESNPEIFAEFTGRAVISVTAREANLAARWKSDTLAGLRVILELLSRLPEVRQALDEEGPIASRRAASRPSHEKILTHVLSRHPDAKIFADFSGRDVIALTAREANTVARWKSGTFACIRKILGR
jgi:hypothetical protein